MTSSSAAIGDLTKPLVIATKQNFTVSTKYFPFPTFVVRRSDGAERAYTAKNRRGAEWLARRWREQGFAAIIFWAHEGKIGGPAPSRRRRLTDALSFLSKLDHIKQHMMILNDIRARDIT